ncbi:MAG TPA: PaaI family thioesterase [Acidimicrobiia bacterium]|nr:PaaI family thioesterase [Acidimicrobiia bacterium]
MSGDGETGGDLGREALMEYLRATFALTPLHQLLGIRMVSTDEPGTVVVEMPVRPEAFNGSGNLHGGAIATLVDVAAGSCAARASNFEPGVNTLVTADLHVRYLGRPKGDVVRAEARVMRAGRQLTVVEVRVMDPLDNVIAFADFSAMLVPRREPLLPSHAGDVREPDL